MIQTFKYPDQGPDLTFLLHIRIRKFSKVRFKISMCYDTLYSICCVSVQFFSIYLLHRWGVRTVADLVRFAAARGFRFVSPSRLAVITKAFKVGDPSAQR